MDVPVEGSSLQPDPACRAACGRTSLPGICTSGTCWGSLRQQNTPQSISRRLQKLRPRTREFTIRGGFFSSLPGASMLLRFSLKCSTHSPATPGLELCIACPWSRYTAPSFDRKTIAVEGRVRFLDGLHGATAVDGIILDFTLPKSSAAKANPTKDDAEILAESRAIVGKYHVLTGPGTRDTETSHWLSPWGRPGRGGAPKAADALRKRCRLGGFSIVRVRQLSRSSPRSRPQYTRPWRLVWPMITTPARCSRLTPTFRTHAHQGPRPGHRRLCGCGRRIAQLPHLDLGTVGRGGVKHA
jgi:hypothetical protein